MSRYLSRPISPERAAVYAYIAANPSSNKKEIVAGTGIDKEKVRMALARGKRTGELIATDDHASKYTIGVLVDRTLKKVKNADRARAAAERRAAKALLPKVEKPKQVRAKKPKATPKKKRPELKQTKNWNLVEVKEVTITYPENYKFTQCIGAKYEPLNLRSLGL